MNTPVSLLSAGSLNVVAELAKVLGNPQRLQLLQQAGQEEMAVERLAELSGLSVANASQHLQQLRRAGLLVARREGKHVLYRPGPGPLAAVLDSLQAWVSHQQEQARRLLDQGMSGHAEVEAVTIAQLQQRLAEGSVLLLDVRSDEEYAAAHLPGAIGIPLAQLQGQLARLTAERSIVAYCSDPHCVLSAQAAALLARSGYRVAHLRGGFSIWQQAGLDLVKAA